MKKLLFIVLLLVFQKINAQEKDTLAADAETAIVPALLHGKLRGEMRYQFISTDNANSDPDAFAHATGLSLTYSTKPYKKIFISIGAAAVARIKSSPLEAADGVRPTRYEISLFDLEHPSKKLMVRPEEVNLNYENEHLKVTIGRQHLFTPFLNPQDGRMRPNMAEGIWMKWKKKETTIQGGWISKVAPRSIYAWKTIKSSIGILPQGITIDGAAGNYSGNIQSGGVAIMGMQMRIQKRVRVQVWENLVENVFNTIMFQLDVDNSASRNSVYASAQAIRQDRIGDGGNPDPSKSYFENKGGSFSYGFRSGWKSEHLDLSLNFNRITSTGRYLFPREWGKEPFFTFMPRERNEGIGNLTAITAAINGNVKALRSSLVVGYFDLPDVKDLRLNKYGLPSYFQVNAEIRYAFHKKFDGVLLYVYKGLAGNDHGEEKYVYNKVNMSLYHLMVNYHF